MVLQVLQSVHQGLLLYLSHHCTPHRDTPRTQSSRWAPLQWFLSWSLPGSLGCSWRKAPGGWRAQKWGWQLQDQSYSSFDTCGEEFGHKDQCSRLEAHFRKRKVQRSLFLSSMKGRDDCSQVCMCTPTQIHLWESRKINRCKFPQWPNFSLNNPPVLPIPSPRMRHLFTLNGSKNLRQIKRCRYMDLDTEGQSQGKMLRWGKICLKIRLWT